MRVLCASERKMYSSSKPKQTVPSPHRNSEVPAEQIMRRVRPQIQIDAEQV